MLPDAFPAMKFMVASIHSSLLSTGSNKPPQSKEASVQAQ
jgi:hypothetical protein